MIFFLIDLFVFYYVLSPITRYSLDIFEIIVAIILLTWLQQFGNQFGGRDNLAEKHEIVSIDGAFNTGSNDIMDDVERR